jgi:hypothetical protein
MQTALRGGTLRMQMMFLSISIGGYPSAPTQVDLEQLRGINAVATGWVERLNDLIATDIPELNQVLEAHDLKVLKPPKPIEIEH